MLIVKSGSIQLPRSARGAPPAFVRQGQLLPEGALPPAEVKRLLELGVLEDSSPAQPAAPAGLPPSRGKWGRDPASLAGKSLDQLRLMVAEIDPSFEVSDLGEADLVQLLSADWDPIFALPRAGVSADRSRPANAKIAKAKRLSEG